jgi:hypothetical protein
MFLNTTRHFAPNAVLSERPIRAGLALASRIPFDTALARG